MTTTSGTAPVARARTMTCRTLRSMFSRRIASRVSTTSPGIFRIEPRSLRRFGISPSKPALR